MPRRLALTAATLAAGLLAPSAAVAQDACPVSRTTDEQPIGSVVSLGSFEGQPNAGSPGPSGPWTGSDVRYEPYGSAPDLPGAELGLPRGFGGTLAVMRTAGASTEEVVAPGIFGPTTLAARVGGTDPAHPPDVELEWLGSDASVLGSIVAQPQPCPEQDGAVTIFRAVGTGPDKPFGTSAIRIRAFSTSAATSFVDGILAAPTDVASTLVDPPRTTHLTLVSVRRVGSRLHVLLRTTPGLERPVDLEVSGVRRGRTVHIRGRALARGAFGSTRTFRLPRALRRGALEIEARYSGDVDHTEGAAVRTLRG